MDTPKESNFDPYSKYIKFIKLISPTKIYELEKIFPIFEKEVNTPETSNENHTIRVNISENLIMEYFSSYIQKC